jgi:nucleotide-binding universal stress UspA family protein
MSLTSKGPSRYVVLAAIDASPDATRVLAEAVQLAHAVRHAELHVVYAPDRIAEADRSNTPFNLEEHSGYLEQRTRETAERLRRPVVGHLIADDTPVSAILGVAAKIDADLVVVGTRDRRGPERWLLGSVAQQVMQRAPCPVLVVRKKGGRAHLQDEPEGSGLVRP